MSWVRACFSCRVWRWLRLCLCSPREARIGSESDLDWILSNVVELLSGSFWAGAGKGERRKQPWCFQCSNPRRQRDLEVAAVGPPRVTWKEVGCGGPCSFRASTLRPFLGVGFRCALPVMPPGHLADKHPKRLLPAPQFHCSLPSPATLTSQCPERLCTLHCPVSFAWQ